jgi:hypothetical protein
MLTDQPVGVARPDRGRRAHPLFEFPRRDPAGPVFVGSPWRAAVIRWTGHALVAFVVVVLGLLVTGLVEPSVPGPEPSPAAVAAGAP